MFVDIFQQQDVFVSRIFVAILCLCLCIRFVFSFYSKVSKFPKGPLPWPVIGNFPYIIIWSWKNKKNINLILTDLGNSFGPVTTFWWGWKPIVVFNDPEIAKEAFSKNKFNDRYEFEAKRLFVDGRGSDIIFTNYNPELKSLRQVATAAIKKFLVSNKLPIVVSRLIDNIFGEIKTIYNEPFDICEHNKILMIKLIASMAFAKNCSLDEEELSNLRDLFTQASKIENLMPANVSPIFKSFVVWLFGRRTANALRNMNRSCQKKVQEHFDTYKDGVVRDFIDSLIAARNESIADGKESSVYLTDHNLGNVVMDLFFAGIDTTLYELNWMYLIMSKHPEMQQKLRQEIRSVIGDRIPVQDDKNQCHYLMAFIHETLRFRPMPFFGIPHQTNQDVEVGGQTIPAQTIILFNEFGIMNNSKYWAKSDEFDPKRFLDSDNCFNLDSKQAFVPFGVGRRRCPGDRLAIDDMFLIVTRVLQLTDGCLFVLPDGSDSVDLECDPNAFHACSPKPYKLLIKPDKM